MSIRKSEMSADPTSSVNDAVLSNRSSWALVKKECDRLEANLSAKRLTLDQFFRYLQTLDPSAKDQLTKMSHAVRDVLNARESMDSFFSKLAEAAPAPVKRFRRLNRA